MRVEWRDGVDPEPAYFPVLVHENGHTEPIVWAPQPGSQEIFLNCPIYEVLYEGTRGPGKTDALLMDFAQHCGEKNYPHEKKGYGAEWKGILFRQTYKQLEDVIGKSKKLFPRIFPGIKFNEAKTFWEWPTGEQLYFRQFSSPDDYWNYHGHAYPWIGWEELTTWINDKCYKSMMSCSRSTVAGMPRKVRATTNPYGPGHNWVKRRWRLPVAPGKIIGKLINDAMDDKGNKEPNRIAIHGYIHENKILMKADPDYISRIRAGARNKSEEAAWIDGSWDIVAGGMFDDLWNPAIHIIPNIPFEAIPRGWRIDRSYDHGTSRPFSVGWWAESNGEAININGKLYGTIPGDLFRIAEWYGWNGNDNEGINKDGEYIAEGILDREEEYGILFRCHGGPADSSIWDDYSPDKSVAGDMGTRGVYWQRADKGPGSRKQGWLQIRKMLKNALPRQNFVREEPGLYICSRCDQFIRTVPVLPRSDNDPDDVNTKVEDHIGDEVRYRVRRKDNKVKRKKWK